MRTSKTKRKAAQSGNCVSLLPASADEWEDSQLFEGDKIFHFLTTQIRQKEKSWLLSDIL